MPFELGMPAIDRSALLAQLRAAGQRCLRERGYSALLAGEAGIGKTWFLHRALEDARSYGLQPLFGQGSTQSDAPPLWPFIQLLRQLALLRVPWTCDVSPVARELGRWIPALASCAAPSGTHSRFQLVDTLVQMLLQAARQRALAIALDDVQAFDPVSLEVLAGLLRETHGANWLLLLSWRDDDRAAARAHAALPLVVSVDATLVLDGLTCAEVEELLASDLGGPAAHAAATDVHTRTHGNPLFVRALAPALRGRAGASAARSLPASLRAALTGRFASLPQGCTLQLQAAAIVGTQFDAATLARIADTSVECVQRELAPALKSGVLRPDPELPGHYQFSHGLLREVLEDLLSEVQRRRLHERTARSLGWSEARSSARVVRHWLASGSRCGLARAALLASRAGRAAAARGAHLDAGQCFGVALRALALWRSTQPVGGGARHQRAQRGGPGSYARRRAQWLLELGAAIWHSGYHDRARSHYFDVAQIARELADHELLAQAAIGCIGSDMSLAITPELIQLCDEACAALPALSRTSAARLLADYGRSLCLSAERPRGARLVRQAVELAAGDEDPTTQHALLVGQFYSLSATVDPARRAQLIERAVVTAQRVQSCDLRLLTHLWRFTHSLEAGDAGRAACEAQTLEATANSYGDPLYQWYAHMASCTLRMLAGEWHGAELRADLALTTGQRAQAPNAAICHFGQLLWRRRLQGRADEILEDLRRATDQFPHMLELRAVLASVYAELGRESQARSQFDRAWAEARDTAHESVSLFALCQLVTVAAALADSEAATQLYSRLAPFATRCVVMGCGQACDGALAHYVGVAAATSGDLACAYRHLREALRVNAAIGAAPQLARSQRELAKLLPSAAQPASQRGTAAEAESQRDGFRKTGDSWLVRFEGRELHVRDELGLGYLALLLERPHVPVHVLELVRGAQGQVPDEAVAQAGGSDLPVRAKIDAWESGIDRESAQDYRRHSARLEHAIELAEERADAAQLERLRRELAFLRHELLERTRGRNPSHERARKAVYNCLRHALTRLTVEHPALGRHLTLSVKTGMHCVYRPEPSRCWSIAWAN